MYLLQIDAQSEEESVYSPVLDAIPPPPLPAPPLPRGRGRANASAENQEQNKRRKMHIFECFGGDIA